jgi:hypothetical protein
LALLTHAHVQVTAQYRSMALIGTIVEIFVRAGLARGRRRRRRPAALFCVVSVL